jgi:subtilisin-like proprotein convertase family protein
MTSRLRWRHRRTTVAVALAAGIAAFVLPSAARADTLTFENATPITIPDLSAANPYPSTIDVAGFTGPVEDVDATVNHLEYECDPDVSILLVGPGGEGTILMSNSGSCIFPTPNETFTFDDEAGAPLPCTEGAAPVASGTYRPTRNACPLTNPEIFPPPAPPGLYPVSLSLFDGTTPNGNWSLFVVDEVGADDGMIAGGWSVTITAPVQADRALSLDANKNKVKEGKKVVLSGRIDAPANEAACEPGQAVELQRSKPTQSAFATFEQLQTDAAGNFSTKRKVKKTFEYRAQVGETATCDDGLSNIEKVKVKKAK